MANVKDLFAWARSQAAPEKHVLDKIIVAEKDVTHSIPGPKASVVDVLRLYPGGGCHGRVDLLCRKLAERTLSTRVRGLAALGLGFADTQETAQQAADALLATLSGENVDDFVAWCAVEALAQLGHAGAGRVRPRFLGQR